MKKLFITFILGFISCLYWMYSKPETRKKILEVFKCDRLDETLKNTLDKIKQKNTAFKNRNDEPVSDTDPVE